jgi:hypothetical protein
LWLFFAVAISLTAFVIVPEFQQLVSPGTAKGILFAAVVAWIFAGSRAVPPLAKYVRDARANIVVFRQQSRGFWQYVDKDNVIQLNVTLHVINRREQNAVLLGPKICVPRCGRKREWQDCFQIEVSGQSIPLGMEIGPRLEPRTVSEMLIRHVHRRAARPRPGILVCLFQMHDQWGRYRLRLRIEPLPAPLPTASPS